MTDFSKLVELTTSRGSVTQIERNGVVLWCADKYCYVSFGDSIAAGHAIDGDWETNYGEGSQYGKNGNTSTVIVPGSYTDLIRNELVAAHGVGRTKATSFARSGDKVSDLIAKLSHAAVIKELEKADLVTICIGANDVLGPVGTYLEYYIDTGDLTALAASVEANLAVLADDTNANSYVALFNKLLAINPNAKYVFTTIYNPYKYLWLEEGHYGFFQPVMETIPDMEYLGIDFDSFIKDSILGTPAVETLFERVNGLCDWSEKWVTALNAVLRSEISAYGSSNIMLTDTKAVYDPYPDRPITAEKHYHDLVNVDYTRDWDMGDIHWGRLWPGSSAAEFWWDLATEHGLDIDGMAEDFVAQTVEKVLAPDIDPHPKAYGQYVMKRSFTDTLAMESLDHRKITYVANGGSGSAVVQEVLGVDGLTAYTSIGANSFTPATGYYFTGWNTAANGSGTAYSVGQWVGISGDVTLYAQWSNVYTLTYYKNSENEYVSPSGETGPVTKNGSEYYLRVTLGGTVIPGLGDSFDSDGYSQTRTITAAYGTELYIQLINTGSKDRGAVYLNGSKVAGNSEYCYYTMTVKHDMKMVFDWEYEIGYKYGVVPEYQSYWIARLTEYPKE